MDTRSAAHSSSIDLPEERRLAKSLSVSAEAVRAATRRRFTLAYVILPSFPGAISLQQTIVVDAPGRELDHVDSIKIALRTCGRSLATPAEVSLG